MEPVLEPMDGVVSALAIGQEDNPDSKPAEIQATETLYIQNLNEKIKIDGQDTLWHRASVDTDLFLLSDEGNTQ